MRRHESGGSARAAAQSKPSARIALLALLALVMAFAVACVQVPAQAFAESATDQDPAASGEITRGEWLGNLVDLFEISVDEEDYPDNYFSDLSSDDEHYLSVLLAVSSGIVDIEPGGEVRANDAATREFVAQTLNYCLGFQLDEGTAYTFSDSADCAYPADDQVAVDKGWFALDNGAFNPKAHVTSEQAKAILDSAASLKKITQPSDDTVSTEYVFQDGVIVVPEETQVLVDGSTITVINAPETINAGSIFVVYLHGVACPYKADSVTTDGAATIIQTSEVAAEAAFKSVNIVGSFDADVTDFEPAEGVQATYLDLDTGEVIDPADNYVDPQSIHATKNGAIVATLDGSLLGIKGNVTITAYNFKLFYKVDIISKQCYVYLTGNQDLSASVSGHVNTDFTLGSIKVNGFGKVGLRAHVECYGNASYTEKNTFKVGAGYTANDGFYLIKGLSQKGWSASVCADANIGVTLYATLGVPFVKSEVYATIGVKASYYMDTYAEGLPRKCETTSLYLYANAGSLLKCFGYESNDEGSIWNWNNSPIRIQEHAEDGVAVDECSRGTDLRAYYTSAASRLSMVGAFGYGSGTGIGADGKPYVIFDYELNDDGNAVITGYHGNAASIIIPETLDGYKVVGIGDGAFANNRTIRSIIIPDQVESIGSRAFAYCSNLAAIVLPQSLGCIESSCFVNCGALTSIDIPGHVTEIDMYAFQGCESLESVYLPDGLKELWPYAFSDCTSIRTIEIPDSLEKANSSGYPDAGPFDGCDNLETATFRGAPTKIVANLFAGSGIQTAVIPDTVTSVSTKAFLNCDQLTKVVFPESVVSIEGQAFAYCTSLESLELPPMLKSLGGAAFFHDSSISSVVIPASLEECSSNYWFGGPFSECDGLEQVSFESGTTYVLGYLFQSCTGLKHIDIPEGVTTIGEYAFDKCTALESVSISDSVTGIKGSAFARCGALTSIEIPDSVASIGAKAFEECAALAQVVLPDNSLTYLGGAAFYNDDALASITIPASLEEVGSDYYQGGPFSNCDGLKEVVFDDGVTQIHDNLFFSCYGLENITVPDGVEKIGDNAFRACKSLVSVDIPASVKKIGYQAFADCKSLRTIVLPDTVEELYNGLFQGCVSLESVHYPESLKYIPNEAFENCSCLAKIDIPDSVEWIGYSAFTNCAALSEICLPSSLGEIYDGAFRNCDALESIVIPDSVVKFGSNMFQDCDALTNVTLSSGLTSIPSYTFEHCDSLASIVIPYRVTSIEANAFTNCTKLTDVIIPKAVESIASGVFSYPRRMTIHGVTGSYAETYAGKNNIKFEAQQVPATKASFDKEELTLKVRDSASLVLSIEPANMTDEVEWKSANEKVATVDASGKVVACSVGTTVIKAGVGDLVAKCKVTVVQPVTSVYVSADSSRFNIGETLQFTASVNPDNANDKSIEWSSSNENVVSVDQTGLATAKAKGTATIKASALDGSGKYGTCTLTVTGETFAAQDVSELASSHPYANSCTDKWTYAVEGADSLDITFDEQTSFEEWSDYLTIFDANGEEVGSYTGTELAGKTVTVPGGSFTLSLSTDRTGSDWGFAVTNVIAKTEAKVFTVTLDVNGELTSVEVPEGKAMSRPDDPELDAFHVFEGWFTDAEMTEEYNFESPVTSSFTLYAKFRDAQLFTVTFDYNFDGASDYRAEEVYEGSIAYSPAYSPTHTGYIFLGWYTDKAATEEYDFNTPVMSNLTLYGGWAPQMFTVSFGGKGSGVEHQTVAYGERATEPAVEQREGRTFEGWWLSEGGTYTQRYDFSQPVTSDLSLMDRWSAEVAFDSNGGSAVKAQKVMVGEAGSKATKPTDPTRSGYAFKGWFSDKGLAQAYDFSSRVSRDTTLYAKWEASSYTVTFNSNGGSAVKAQSVKYGAKASKPTNPTKAGCTFNGWYSDKGLTKAYDFNTAVKGSVTLYAKWTVNSYTVSFNANGGSAVKSQTVKYGAKASKPADPTRSGYAFKGWYSDKGLMKAYDFNAAVKGNLTLYAKWEKAAPAAPTRFKDVDYNDWYGDWVTRASSSGLMTGLKDDDGNYTGYFDPVSPVTRAQVATVLWRIAGSPSCAGSPMPDVAGHWAQEAVAWCVSQGIVTGYSSGPWAGTFRPDAEVSREEFAVMVWRFAKWSGAKVTSVPTASFYAAGDYSAVQPWAKEAMQWCAAAGVITGVQGRGPKPMLAPQETATRAQAAKIFVTVSDIVSGSVSPYADGVDVGEPVVDDQPVDAAVETPQVTLGQTESGLSYVVMPEGALDSEGVAYVLDRKYDELAGRYVGPGLYVTSYKGDAVDLALPAQIDGIDVVSADLAWHGDAEAGLPDPDGRTRLASLTLERGCKIVSLDASGNGLAGLGLKGEEFLGGLPALRFLDLSGMELAELDPSLAPALESLALRNCLLAADAFEALSSWRGATGLAADLEGAGVKDEPADPADPGQPSEPEQPVGSEQPVVPADPAAPDQPSGDVPDGSPVPAEPSNPEVPGQPAVDPAEPSDSGVVEAPGESADSEGDGVGDATLPGMPEAGADSLTPVMESEPSEVEG